MSIVRPYRTVYVIISLWIGLHLTTSRLSRQVLLQYRYIIMSFYSLLVRDHKRSWNLMVDSGDKTEMLEARKRVLEHPELRCQILKTDGNSRNIQAGVDYIKNVNGRGLAKIFGFTRLV